MGTCKSSTPEATVEATQKSAAAATATAWAPTTAGTSTASAGTAATDCFTALCSIRKYSFITLSTILAAVYGTRSNEILAAPPSRDLVRTRQCTANRLMLGNEHRIFVVVRCGRARRLLLKFVHERSDAALALRTPHRDESARPHFSLCSSSRSIRATRRARVRGSCSYRSFDEVVLLLMKLVDHSDPPARLFVDDVDDRDEQSSSQGIFRDRVSPMVEMPRSIFLNHKCLCIFVSCRRYRAHCWRCRVRCALTVLGQIRLIAYMCEWRLHSSSSTVN